LLSLAAICIGGKIIKEGEHSILEGGKWGFINRRGEVVISSQFDDAKPFRNDKAEVKLNAEWVYIDKQGRVIK
jgi:hypothetical protein